MSELLVNRENMVFAHRQTEWKETGRQLNAGITLRVVLLQIYTGIGQIEIVLHLIISVEICLVFSVQSCLLTNSGRSSFRLELFS